MSIGAMILSVWVGAMIGFLMWRWVAGGFHKGRRYGNRIAAHLGMEKNLFHTLVEHGGVPAYPLMYLSSLHQAGLSEHDAAVILAPALRNGLLDLDARFGAQKQLEAAKPVIAKLLQELESRQERGAA